MGMKPLETVFFIPRSEEYDGEPCAMMPDLLLQKAGAIDLNPNSPRQTRQLCLWGGWHCYGALIRFRFHDLLYIIFSQSTVANAMEEEEKRGERPDLPNLTDAFETACVNLQVPVAVIFRSLGSGDEGWLDTVRAARTKALHEIDAELQAKSATTLMKLSYAAFYLNKELAQTVELPWGIQEVHDLEPGYVVFRGDFETRWIWYGMW